MCTSGSSSGWAGYSSEHNSWEPAKRFTPDLQPELEAVRLQAKRAAGTLPPEGGSCPMHVLPNLTFPSFPLRSALATHNAALQV
jgi:hypothetical protein